MPCTITRVQDDRCCNFTQSTGTLFHPCNIWCHSAFATDKVTTGCCVGLWTSVVGVQCSPYLPAVGNVHNIFSCQNVLCLFIWHPCPQTLSSIFSIDTMPLCRKNYFAPLIQTMSYILLYKLGLHTPINHNTASFNFLFEIFT